MTSRTFLATVAQGSVARRFHPGYYASMQRGNDTQQYMGFATSNPAMKGMIKRYTWRSFEPTEGNYTENPEMVADLTWCAARGLYLIVMIEDQTYGYADNQPAPDYLIPWTVSPTNENGFCLARWDPYVTTRWKALLDWFASQYASHPVIEAVMCEETTCGFRTTADYVAPAGKNYITYTPQLYRAELITRIQYANTVMPLLRWFFYMNFFPGNQDGTYLEDVVNATEPNIAICGPDAEQTNVALQNRTFWVYRNHKTTCPIMCHMSTQVYQNEPTLTGEQWYDFMVNDLGANYICPVYTIPSASVWNDKIVPMMNAHPTFNPEVW